MMVKHVPGSNVTVVPLLPSAVSISSARTCRVNSYVFWLIGLWIKYAFLPFCCFAVNFTICCEEWDAGFGGVVRDLRFEFSECVVRGV
jgi:hypothetical protein